MNDPRGTARLAGILWLVVIAGGVVSVVTQTGQPRLAFAANLFSGLCYLGVTVLLYQLFRSCGPTRRLRASTSRWCFSVRRSSRSAI